MKRSDSDPDIERRALELLELALERPSVQREAWVTELRGEPEKALARLRELLCDVNTGDDFFAPEVRRHSLVDRSGARVGAFELVEMLAVGGMSVVYRARRADGAYQQDVAVKLFAAAHLDDTALARFDTERRIAATLEHPGIARVVDGGAMDDGTPYLVMELVRGAPIDQWCARHEVPLERRLRLVRSVCDALTVAHAAGIVHRDLKASNILVDDSGQPKLIDFGIAKVLEPEKLDLDVPETRMESRVMTPAYASPEQLRGEPVSRASDVYSLSVVLYELLTGRRPHRLAGLSMAEAERLVSSSVPLDPSRAVGLGADAIPPGLGSGRGLSRRLRGDLDRIVMTGLRLDPSDRYGSSAELSDELDRALRGEPVRARGASRLYRLSRFLFRYRAPAAALAAVFLSLLTGLLAVQHQAREAQRQRDVARSETKRAESALAFVVEMIQRADPFENAAAPTLAGALKQALPGLDLRFADQPQLEADLRFAIGFALQNLGEVGVARTQLERALAVRTASNDRLGQAEAIDALALVDWWESDFDSATKRFEQALSLLEAAESSPRARLLRTTVLANWAALRIDSGDHAGSERLAREALSAAEAEPAVALHTRAAIWSTLATALEGLARPDEALEAFQRTLELQREATGEMHPSYAIVLNNLALAYHRADRLDDAIEATTRSVEIRRATLGDTHPQTATALFNLSRLLTIAGELTTAETLAREALAVARGGYAPGHPRIGKAHEALALVLEAQGRLGEALREITAAKSIYGRAEGVDPAWIRSAEDISDRIAAAIRESPPGRAQAAPPV